MDSGNEYVIQVKKNQKKMFESIAKFTRENDPVDRDYTKEKNRNREENRELFLYDLPQHMRPEGWPTARHIIEQRTYGIRGTKKYKQVHYYITSRKETDAHYYTPRIRGHWGIENRLHWVKDAILNEDKGMIKGMSLSSNISMIRNLVINIFRINNYKSIKAAIEKYANRISESLDLMNNYHMC